MYYGAVLDELVESGKLDRRTTDFHFTHCSGANRIHEAVSSLVAAKIPTASILDMDVLEDATVLQRIIDAHGGLPQGISIDSQLNTLRSHVKQTSRPVLRRDADARIKEVLGSAQTDHLTPTDVSLIRQHIRSLGGWQDLETRGLSALIGTGEPYRAAKKIIEVLAGIGIYVVPNGELESFHPSLDRKDKQRWLAEAIEEKLYAELGDQLDFVQSTVEYLLSQNAP